MSQYIITSNLYDRLKIRFRTTKARAERLYNLLERKINAGVAGSATIEFKKDSRSKKEVIRSVQSKK